MAIDLIENFTTDTSSFEAYENDLKTQSAVERQLGIIGEALNKLRKLNNPFQLKTTNKSLALGTG